MKVADNRKQLKRHIKRSIASNGFAILSVNPPPVFGANPVNYSYTVGLSHKGLPELFICGPIPNSVMGAILKNQANAWLREKVASYEVRTDIVKSTAPDKVMRSNTRLLHGEEAVTKYCVELKQRAGKGLQVAQVMYPDMANVLPGESDYDTRYRQDLITVEQSPQRDIMSDIGPRGTSTVAESTQFMSDVLGGEERPVYPADYQGPKLSPFDEPSCAAGDLKGNMNLGEHCYTCDSPVVEC
jgi:hypothetical protein